MYVCVCVCGRPFFVSGGLIVNAQCTENPRRIGGNITTKETCRGADAPQLLHRTEQNMNERLHEHQIWLTSHREEVYVMTRVASCQVSCFTR